MTYTITVEKDEQGYYVAEVNELQGCHTQGKTLSQSLERLAEAVTLYEE